jgi:hypothetical protein
MSNEPTIEQMNVEIARFEGRKWMGRYTIDRFGGNTSNAHPEMKYHSSWDWLMPVWDQFRDLKFKEETAMKLHLSYVARLAQDIAYGTLEEVHHNLHIAIQWYNKQSTTTNDTTKSNT